MNLKQKSGIILLLFLFVGGVVGGYLYFSKVIPQEKTASEETANNTKSEDLLSLRIYYPVGDQLQMEERRPPKRTGSTAIAEAAVDEYLKGSAVATIAYLPRGARLLGLYKGTDGMLYIDLSDEFRRNFQGDVFAEFLLLKGLYESIISNVQDIQDIKILIEGKETETLGGHLFLLYPLKDMVSHEQ
jgi:spore germination protein GerM